MMNAGNLKGKTRQTSDWRRRMIAFVSALTLLISSCGLTAFAESDEDIYSDPVTAPIPASDTSPEPEEGKAEATPAPEDQPETGTEPQETTGEETETGEEPEVSEEPEDLTVYEPGTLTAEADGIGITVDYTAEARVPEGAVLTLTRAAGGDLYSALKSASKVLKTEENVTWKRELGEDAVFYAITLTDSEGNEVHPETGVTLTCTNLEIPADATGFVTGENAENLDWKDTITVGFLPDAIGYAYLKQVQIGTVTLTHEDRDYMVTAAYGPDAGFPADTELKVREILPGTPEYALYSGMTDEALNEDWAEITLERYFDIAFVANGEELEPKADVDVQIVFRDKIEQNEETEVAAVHIENNEANVIEAETDSTKSTVHDNEAIDTVTFTSDSFSVYGVVQKKKITQKVLAADGNTYEINVTYGPEAEIPEGAELKVEEIPEGSDLWEAYRKQTAAALGADDVRLPGLYDITIIFEGREVEPKAPIIVAITLANAEAGNEELNVVHFKEEIPQELVDAATEQTEVQPLAQEDQINAEHITDTTIDGQTVTFETDGFSIYAFAYTVVVYYKVATGETYRIRLDYNEDSGIPAGSVLKVDEILPEDARYAGYLEQAIKAATKTEDSEENNEDTEEAELIIPDDQYARFFDIEIQSNGQKVEPTGKVSVTVELADAPEDRLDELKVVHFATEKTEVIDAQVSADNITFETDSFSVYAVIVTPKDDDSITNYDGKQFVIKRGNQYVTSNIIWNGSTNLLEKSTKASDAAIWTFEAIPNTNKYGVYTYKGDQKVYIVFEPRDNGQNAHIKLETYSTWIEVINNHDGTYSLKGYVNESRPNFPRSYFLNEYNKSDGFGGWYQKNGDGAFYINFQEVEEHYAVIVNPQNSDNYYAVQSDGSLQKVVYHPDDNSVEMEYPLFWEYIRENGKYNLRIHSEASKFDGSDLPEAYYYRYIDPNTQTGYTAETIYTEDGPSEAARQKADAAHPGYVNNAAIVYENHKIHGQGNNYYLGVDEENLHLTGQVNADSAANVYFAKATKVLPSRNLNHTVNHIDISIEGGASVKVPLEYGEYYYTVDGQRRTLIVNAENPVKLELKKEHIDITPEDMKKASITAYSEKNKILKDAFYITGYSQNRDNGYSTAQVRVEGSFRVADTDPIYGKTEDELTATELDNRLKNKITYTVTVSKEQHFELLYEYEPGKTVQLYDASNQPLSTDITVNLSKSFDYWDPDNECPPIKTINPNVEIPKWKAGHIIWDASGHTGSGMDFKLVANTELPEQSVEIVIHKKVVSSDGTVLHSNSAITNHFIVYQKSPATTGDIAGVEAIGIGTNTDKPSYEDYSGKHTKSISIGSQDDGGFVRDIDVKPGMVFIEEDKDSVPDIITDTEGQEWKYINTYIETSYAWRQNGDDSKIHTIQGMKSVPEVIGEYHAKDQSTQFNNLVEFNVYNVYVPATDITVKKQWEDGYEKHTDDTVRLKLVRYSKDNSTTGTEEPETPEEPTEPSTGSELVTLRFVSSSDNLSKEYKFTKGSTVTITFENNNPGYNPYDRISLSGAVNGIISVQTGTNSFTVTMNSDRTIILSETGYSNFGEVTNCIQLSPTPSSSSLPRNMPRALGYRAFAGGSSGGTNGMPSTYTIREEIQTVILQNEHWSETIENLPIYDENGNPYYYAIEEVSSTAEGYTIDSISPSWMAATSGTILSVVNKKEEEPRSITVTKAWADSTSGSVTAATWPTDNGQYVPEYITVKLQRRAKESTDPFADVDGVATQNIYPVANAEQNHQTTATFTIPNDGFEYRVAEVNVPTGYLTEPADITENTNLYVITNTKSNSKLIVRKVWRGVPDDTGYPDVTFDLYQVKVYNGYPSANEGDRTLIRSGITLSKAGNDYTWICTEELPTKVDGQDVGYMVIENPNTGNDGGLNWEVYAYTSAYDTENKRYAKYGDKNQPYQAAVIGNEGEIWIHNRLSNAYIQMDIKKQFFMVHDDGAWDNVTSQMCKNVILGFRLLRRIKRADNDSVIETWHEYGDEMLVGYGSSINDPKFDNGTNGFYLESGGGDWHFRIRDQGGDINSEHIGLPVYGLYNDHGTYIKVKYEYSFRETGVYKNLQRVEYPDWEWLSTITPDRYWTENGFVTHEFGLAFSNQDPERVANYQASNLVVEKRWLGEPDADEVYVKIFRYTGDVSHGDADDDFTATIAADIRGYSGHGVNGSNWQDYMGENTNVIDLEHECIILKANSSGNWKTSIKTHKALISNTGNEGEGNLYHYYAKEIGYKKDGVKYWVTGDSNPLEIYETRYNAWIPGAGWPERAVAEPSAATIEIKGKDNNKLQVMNAPMMDLKVKKMWLDESGNPHEPWANEVKFMVRQERTKWLNEAPTEEKQSVYLTMGGSKVFTLKQHGQTATLTTDHINHDVYGMTVTDSNVGDWTILIKDLQRGFFDEHGNEWHCKYSIEEVDTVYSSIETEDLDPHHTIITIKNTYDVKKAAVKVTKVFSGLIPGEIEIPQNFTITAKWHDDENNEGTMLTKELTLANAQSGDGSADNPYVWTINEIPLGNTVTFEESHYSIEGVSVSVKANGQTVDLSNPETVPTATAIAGNPAEETTAVCTFENNYGVMTGALKLTKTVTVQGTAPISGNAALTDGTYSFVINGTEGTDTADIEKEVRITFENGNAISYQIDKDPEETVSGTGYSYTVIIPNLIPGRYTVAETDPDNGTILTNVSANIVAQQVATVTVTAGDVTASSPDACAEFTNNRLYATATPVVSKNLNGEPFTGGTERAFTFILTQISPAADEGENPFTKSASTNQTDGSITFEEIEYDAAGIYVYSIAEETDEDDDTMAYDRTVYYAKVEVTEANNALSAAISYYTDEECTVSALNGVVFNNTELTSIQVTKEWTLNGSNVDGSGSIGFEVHQVAGSADIVLSPVYTAAGTDEPVSTSKPTVTYGNNGWETITVSRLPKYVNGVEATYYVVETTVTDADTKITYKVNDGSETETASSATTTGGIITIINKDYQVDINVLKIDETTRTASTQKPLKDAVFKLEKYAEATEGTAAGYSVYPNAEDAQQTSDTEGRLTFAGLSDGKYRITEVTPPPGYYNGAIVIYFMIENGIVTYTDEAGNRITEQEYVTYMPQDAEFVVGNTPGAELPATGGSGTLIYTITGIFLITLAGTLLVARKRKANR